ncbi:MAG TPA: quaternary ammonium compound efflux SMR transporter SugE [Methylophaga aminisulfidivorans]|uniref:Guanidinium exporter n=1 Tax=Methylophaga aminisulfidivorans TaxID=230105 RepID=A0A7C1ZW60_9GAMM|nr:quaternary ammonium compound efflux SMR transporter SugE [Methylophaga aminisulfidivorans]
MAWLALFLAGILEVTWATGLKYTDGLTRFWPTVATGALVVASLWLLSVSMRTLPIGTAYTVWAGIGTVGTVILGIVLLGESASPMRLLSIALIIVGILGLKLAH